MIVKILHQLSARVRVFWLVAVIIIANNGDGGRLAVLKPIKQDRHLPLRSCQTRSPIGDSRRRKGSLAGPPDHSPPLSNLLRVLNPLYVCMYVVKKSRELSGVEQQVLYRMGQPPPWW